MYSLSFQYTAEDDTQVHTTVSEISKMAHIEPLVIGHLSFIHFKQATALYVQFTTSDGSLYSINAMPQTIIRAAMCRNLISQMTIDVQG